MINRMVLFFINIIDVKKVRQSKHIMFNRNTDKINYCFLCE